MTKEQIYDEIRQIPKISGFNFSNKNGFYIKNIDPLNEKKHIHIKSLSVPTKLLHKHLHGHEVLSLELYPYTKNVIIDIDGRNNKNYSTHKIVRELVKWIGEPFYIEYSHTSKGYHLYYQFKEYITKNAASHLCKEFRQKTHYCIECKTSEHKSCMRLFYSYQYRTAGKYDPKYRIPICTISSWKELIPIFSDISPLPMPKVFYGHNVRGFIVERESIGAGHGEGYIFSKNYSYGEGHRIQAQIEIAFQTLHAQEGFNSFIQKCEFYNDGSSKDMKSTQKMNILKSIWIWCQNHYSSGIAGGSSFEKIISEYSDNHIFINNSQIDASIKKEILEMFKFYAGYFNLPIKKDKDAFIADSYKLYEFIRGKYLYDSYTRNDSYMESHLQPLNKAALFPVSLRDSICKLLKIKRPKLQMKFLQLTGIIELAHSLDGYAKSYKGKLRWASHYIASNNLISNALEYYRKLRYFLAIHYIYIYIYKNYTLYNISYLTSHKLYRKFNYHEHVQVLINRYKKCLFNENKAPPDGLEGRYLDERLKALDKKYSLHYTTG